MMAEQYVMVVSFVTWQTGRFTKAQMFTQLYTPWIRKKLLRKRNSDRYREPQRQRHRKLDSTRYAQCTDHFTAA